MEAMECEMSSLSDLSAVDSEQEDFEFVEDEAKIHVSDEAHFIAQYKSYVAIADAYRNQQELGRNLELKSAQIIRQYLNTKLPQIYSRLQNSLSNNAEDGDWVLTARPSRIDSILNTNLRMLKKSCVLFIPNELEICDSFLKSSDSTLYEQLEKWTQKFEKLGSNLTPISCEYLKEDIGEKLEKLSEIKPDSYSVDQHSFDYKLLKKSLNVVKNILNTTTAEKFALIRSYEEGEHFCGSSSNIKNSSSKLRTALFGLLDHLKRWFAHLSQRFAWFLEFKYEKLGYCCEESTRERILRELPTIEMEFRWLLDEFLSNFKLAFSLCERYGHSDIMHFFYEALVQSCLAKRPIFEQICWKKLPASLEHLNQHLQLMEHQASVLEKIIFTNPIKLVGETDNSEEAYCGYIWLKFDLCLQHFRSLFDARLKGFQINKGNGKLKQWLDWVGKEELALKKLPLTELKSETYAELYLLQKAKQKTAKFNELMLEFDTLQGVGKDYELLIEDLSID